VVGRALPVPRPEHSRHPPVIQAYAAPPPPGPPRTPELPADAASAPAEAPAKPAPEAGTAAPARPVEPAAPVVTPEKRPPVTAPAAPAAVAERPVPADPNAPRARLVLRVEEDTWADVRDADDRRLLYQTIAAGRVVSVEGVAPLNVFLGNVDGVRVEFNGQSYDARAHKRGHVARFTLGAAGPRR
jgi:cytoskeleton protein RodZ